MANCINMLKRIKQALLTWKRPKPQKWNVGDVFCIPLSDGRFTFGQALWAEFKSSPNCALFDCRDRKIPPIDIIISSTVISVLNIGSHELDGFTWKVVGNAPVNIKKSQVPKMHRGEHGVG